MRSCDFSYKHYEQILFDILNSDYKIVDYNNKNSYLKEIIIRHDIDLDLKKALKMAEIEKDIGVKSNYFFWMTSPFYNIFDYENSAMLNKIIKLGHNVGIHFDEGTYECLDEKQLQMRIIRELKIFELYFQYKTNIISFHMPKKNLLNNKFEFDGIINAYHSKYFTQYKYLSDSEMRWREGCICKNLKSNNYNKIQVLFHPFWWSDNSNSSFKLISDFKKYKNSLLQYNWDKHIKVK